MSKYIFGIALSIGLIFLAGCRQPAEVVIDQVPADPRTGGLVENNLADGEYEVVPAQSEMRWQGENVVGRNHQGTIEISGGSFTVREGRIISGQAFIDMATIADDGGSERLVSHLSSADFFDVASYPEARIMITSTEEETGSSGPGRFSAQADLTIKDRTNPVNFVFSLSSDDGFLTAETEFTIDRTDWDVRYGSGKFFAGLGDSMIKDEIKYAIMITAEKL